jgi:osmotically-inducible protein OsmY
LMKTNAISVGRRRLAVAAGTLAVVAAVVLWGLWAARQQAAALRFAGSEHLVMPVGPVHLVAAMSPKQGAGGRGARGRDPAQLSDVKIQVAIATKLTEMNLPVQPLDITVEQRRVTLEGTVDDDLLRDAIEVTVRSVDGVRQVDNRIESLEK